MATPRHGEPLDRLKRRGDEGFGEGNFRALFESIEEDQIRHGVLRPSDGKRGLTFSPATKGVGGSW
ncbi:MAG: hypothetical protein ACKVP5_16930 [Aestuariivirga sp.]